MYKIKREDEALISLSRFDKKTEKEIKNKVEKHLSTDPFWNDKPLKGRWEGLWRLHLDDHRAIYKTICEIREKEVIVAAIIKIGKRKDVYKGDLPRIISTSRSTKRPRIRDLKKKK